jgi:hypothetical protein
VAQRFRRQDVALSEQLERLTDEAALNDAVIRLQASELAAARVRHAGCWPPNKFMYLHNSLCFLC